MVRGPLKKKPACEGIVLKIAGWFKAINSLESVTTPGAQ